MLDPKVCVTQVVGFTRVFNFEIDQLIRKFTVRGAPRQVNNSAEGKVLEVGEVPVHLISLVFRENTKTIFNGPGDPAPQTPRTEQYWAESGEAGPPFSILEGPGGWAPQSVRRNHFLTQATVYL